MGTSLGFLAWFSPTFNFCSSPCDLLGKKNDFSKILVTVYINLR